MKRRVRVRGNHIVNLVLLFNFKLSKLLQTILFSQYHSYVNDIVI
jgi:hypothetical protein